MALKWRDCTGYSQGDRERVQTGWQADIGPLRVTVTCGHIYYKGKWIMHCDPFFRERPLGDDITNAVDAQNRALALVRAKLTEAQAAIDAASVS